MRAAKRSFVIGDDEATAFGRLVNQLLAVCDCDSGCKAQCTPCPVGAH
jgi:hypothetical protein